MTLRERAEVVRARDAYRRAHAVLHDAINEAHEARVEAADALDSEDPERMATARERHRAARAALESASRKRDEASREYDRARGWDR